MWGAGEGHFEIAWDSLYVLETKQGWGKESVRVAWEGTSGKIGDKWIEELAVCKQGLIYESAWSCSEPHQHSMSWPLTKPHF